jgi:hypothetical protein
MHFQVPVLTLHNPYNLIHIPHLYYPAKLQLHVCLEFQPTPQHVSSSHPFKDAGVIADSLTVINNAMVKCLFVVNIRCMHKGF